MLETPGCCCHPALNIHITLKRSTCSFTQCSSRLLTPHVCWCSSQMWGFAGKNLCTLHRGTPCHLSVQGHHGKDWQHSWSWYRLWALAYSKTLLLFWPLTKEMFITGLGLAVCGYPGLPCVSRAGNISLPEEVLRQELTPAELLRFLPKGGLCFQ